MFLILHAWWLLLHMSVNNMQCYFAGFQASSKWSHSQYPATNCSFFSLSLCWHVTFWVVRFHCCVVFHLNLSNIFMILLCVDRKVFSSFSLLYTGLLWAFLCGSCANVQEFLQVTYVGVEPESEGIYICIFTPDRCCQKAFQSVWVNLHCR